MNKNEFIEKTNRIRSFPNHLKYTLFANEKIKSVRQKEFAFTHLLFEEFKEKGNKNYKKGKFKDSIDCYVMVLNQYLIQAYSLLKWIEFKGPQNYINLLQSPTPILDDAIILKQCKIDDNIIEQDTFREAIVNLLLCLSYAYMELRHYSSALDCLNECVQYADDCFADFYFRRSQARAYNKLSNDESLLLSLVDIQKAICLINGNKIYNEHLKILTELMESKKSDESYKIESK